MLHAAQLTLVKINWRNKIVQKWRKGYEVNCRNTARTRLNTLTASNGHMTVIQRDWTVTSDIQRPNLAKCRQTPVPEPTPGAGVPNPQLLQKQRTLRILLQQKKKGLNMAEPV